MTRLEKFKKFLHEDLKLENVNDFEPLDLIETDIEAPMQGCWGLICPKEVTPCKKCQYHMFWNEEVDDECAKEKTN